MFKLHRRHPCYSQGANSVNRSSRNIEADIALHHPFCGLSDIVDTKPNDHLLSCGHTLPYGDFFDLSFPNAFAGLSRQALELMEMT